jgi:hypothetical protein
VSASGAPTLTRGGGVSLRMQSKLQQNLLYLSKLADGQPAAPGGDDGAQAGQR